MPDLQTLGQMIRTRRERRGLTLDVLAAQTGISKPYLSNIETARTPGPASAGKLELLERALGFAAAELCGLADWLRTPESVRKLLAQAGVRHGDSAIPRRPDGAVDLDALLARKNVEGLPSPGPEIPGAQPVKTLPLINRVAAGKAAEFTDLDYPAGVADQYVAAAPAAMLPHAANLAMGEAERLDRGMFALRVTGDSMEPEYAAGDVIILTPGKLPADGDDCLVRLGPAENFSTTFKRVRLIRNGGGETTHVRLEPLNKKHAQRVVAVEEISGMYVVVWKMVAVGRVEGKNAKRETRNAKRAAAAVESGAVETRGAEPTMRSVALEQD